MGVISIVNGIINQLITMGAPPCTFVLSSLTALPFCTGKVACLQRLFQHHGKHQGVTAASSKPPTFRVRLEQGIHTWWLIPLSKWVITPVISGLTLLIPFITGVITHLLSGMNHQVYLVIWNWISFGLNQKPVNGQKPGIWPIWGQFENLAHCDILPLLKQNCHMEAGFHHISTFL